MSNRKFIQKNSQNQTGQLNLNQLTQPIHVSHVKLGSTLCSNGNTLLFQDGPTTLIVHPSPSFQPKKVSWRYGLLRDITWCSPLGVFILLTRDALLSFDPKPLLINEKAPNRPIVEIRVNTYENVKPYDDNNTFWRCACVGKTLYITYSGFGSAIDEYALKAHSCKLVNRWTPPKSCAVHEGIWCIRYHSETNQLGFSIMDSRNNRWRIEIRNRQKLTPLWQIPLPLSNGDGEITPLPNNEWLVINSSGIRLIQIANQELKVAVAYERELKNAVVFGNLYIAVRTRNTIEIHRIN